MRRACRQKFFVDVIVTSPPYNIDKRYSMYNDKISRRQYLKWMNKVANLSMPILRDNGSFFLNIGGTLLDPLIPFQVLQEFLKAGYKLQNTIHWIKSISIEVEDIGKNNFIKTDSSIGHFKPIISQRFLSDLHEYIFHFTKKGDIAIDKLAVGVTYQDKSNIKRWKSAKTDKRDRGNIWFIPYNTIQEKRPHPATFPEKLPYMCIKLHGIRKNTVIYDPFIGIGTTALACINLNVEFLGTDIDNKYIEIANENIKLRFIKKNEKS